MFGLVLVALAIAQQDLRISALREALQLSEDGSGNVTVTLSSSRAQYAAYLERYRSLAFDGEYHRWMEGLLSPRIDDTEQSSLYHLYPGSLCEWAYRAVAADRGPMTLELATQVLEFHGPRRGRREPQRFYDDRLAQRITDWIKLELARRPIEHRLTPLSSKLVDYLMGQIVESSPGEMGPLLDRFLVLESELHEARLRDRKAIKEDLDRVLKSLPARSKSPEPGSIQAKIEVFLRKLEPPVVQHLPTDPDIKSRPAR